MRNLLLNKKALNVTILAVGMIFFGFNYSSASLSTPYEITDTTTQLVVHWNWTGQSTEQVTTYLSLNWQANFNILNLSDSGAGWVAGWGFQHLLGPHPEDKTPGKFYSEAAFTPEFPFFRSGYWPHETNPTGAHSDYWTFNISALSSGIQQTVTMNVTHTPIPAAAWLLGAGLVGLVALRRPKKNQS
jgi:hypothetical protein